MTIQMIGGLSVPEIRGMLCVYDARSPDYAEELKAYGVLAIDIPAAAQPDCGCNNCFYGRHALANALLIAGDAA